MKTEFVIPKGRHIAFKFRSRDVIHSAYMPHFRAQMNCVPGMITEFSFVPTVTTAEMREEPGIVSKVAKINEIRTQRRANGEVDNVDEYTFDYLLLCNKICGASHYNMQMKIVVETQEEYEAWIKEQKEFKNALIN